MADNSQENYGKEVNGKVDKENVKVKFDTTEVEEVETEKVETEGTDAGISEEETPVIETEASEDEADGEVADTPEVVDDFADEDPADDNTGDSSTDGNTTDGGSTDGNPADDESEEEHQSVSAIEDEDSTGTRVENSLEYSATFNGQTRSSFATLNEQLEALWTLVNDTYGETDNEWYTIDADSEKKLVYMHGWSNHYRQSYKVKNDVFSLTGDRTRIYPMWVSADEKKEIENMKFNYSSIESELNSYKEKELHSQCEAILASEDYSIMNDFEEFKNLKANMDTYSIDELTNMADLLYAKYMKSHFSISNKSKSKNSDVIPMASANTENIERLPYGGLFKNFKRKK